MIQIIGKSKRLYRKGDRYSAYIMKPYDYSHIYPKIMMDS